MIYLLGNWKVLKNFCIIILLVEILLNKILSFDRICLIVVFFFNGMSIVLVVFFNDFFIFCINKFGFMLGLFIKYCILKCYFL